MCDHPSSFKADLVRAILEDRKTQTRRLITERTVTISGDTCPRKLWGGLDFSNAYVGGEADQTHLVVARPFNGSERVDELHRVYPRVRPGDRLWVRENFSPIFQTSGGYEEPSGRVWYQADGSPEGVVVEATANGGVRWTPSIHMPRNASRILLDVKAVRFERLHAITEDDARAEGVAENAGPCDHVRYTCEEVECLGPGPVAEFALLWDSINAERTSGKLPAAFAANPWVLVYAFSRVS